MRCLLASLHRHDSMREIYHAKSNFQTEPASIKTQRKVPERDSSLLRSVGRVVEGLPEK
ncbi:MAG: hypothetical protein IKY85_06325 [Bacteroidaceae bacterium]|nr:hypothetical protein [Bacteroidaceae bacterium]